MLRKCNDCCRLREWRKLATSPEDISRINAEFTEHLNSMFKDRLVDAQWCQSAAAYAKQESASASRDRFPGCSLNLFSTIIDDF